MNILTEAARILRRSPSTVPTLATVDGKRRGKQEAPPAPTLPSAPATAEELEALLQRLYEQRAQALALINSQEDRRAELLMQDGSDDAILALAREADIAALNVERIEVLESEARYQLGLRRNEHDRSAWVRVRDSYCQGARQYYEIMRQAEAIRTQVEANRQIVIQAFPNAGDVIPVLPFFSAWQRSATGTAAVRPFEASKFDVAMGVFARTAFEPAPSATSPARGFRTVMDEVAAYIRGEVDDIPSLTTWGVGGVPGADMEVLIAFSGRSRLATGEVVEKGEKVRVTALEAREMVRSGKAFLVTLTPEPNEGKRISAALPPVLSKAAE